MHFLGCFVHVVSPQTNWFCYGLPVASHSQTNSAGCTRQWLSEVGCPPAWLFDFFHRGRYQLVLNPSTGASRLPRLTRLVSIGAVLMHAGSLLTRSIRPNESALVCGSIVLRASPRTHSAYSHRNSRWLILNRVTNALTFVL